MKRRLLVAAVLVALVAAVAALAGSIGSSRAARAAYPVPRPTVTDFQFIKASTPTEADCEAVARTCFTPQAIRSAYNLAPLYAAGLNGRGVTIAIVDSYGSDTMAHDLHVFNQAFGLQPMCGEESVTCAPGMPKFSELAINGSPDTKAQPGNGTHLEDKSAWALEVALDVETSHAIAPMTASLQNLRYAFQNAAANGVTVLGSSGDGGSANGMKSPVATGGKLIPYPTVVWPASDPLVTGVGGTYLCTDPNATGSPSRATYFHVGIGAKCGSNTFNAAHVAIADQLNKASHPNEFGLGLINPALYKLAANAGKYSADFFDINHTAVAGVANNNQGDPSVPGYPATDGWDPVTGLGTPNAASLIPDIVAAAHS